MSHSHDRTLLAKMGFADPDRKSPIHDLACQYLVQPERMAKVFEHVHGAQPQAGPLLTTTPRIFENEINFDGWEWSMISDVASSYVGHLERMIMKGTGQYQTTIGFVDVELVSAWQRSYEGKRHKKFVAGHAAWNSSPVVGDEITISGANRDKPDGILEKTDVSPNGRPQYHIRCTSGEQRILESLTVRKWIPATGGDWEHFSFSESRNVTIAIEVKSTRVPVGDILRQLALYREWYRAPDDPHGWSRQNVLWLLATCYPISQREAEEFRRANINHVRLSPERIQEWAKTRDDLPHESPEV